MWVAIVSAISGLLVLAIRKWNKRVIAEDDLGELREAVKNKQDAEAGINKRRNDLSDVFDDELSDDDT